MQYWIDDEQTDTVGLYLESMGNPRKFSRIARQLAAGQTGHRRVVRRVEVRRARRAPHPYDPRAGQAFDALLRQAGVIRVENIHQLFDVAQLTLHQPMPGGERVAIVGNSDALGALSASACLSWGLEVTHGPVSLLPQASAEEFAAALDVAFADPDVDSVVACFIPPLATLDEEVTAAVRTVVARYEKPCVATFLGMRGVAGGLSYSQADGVRRSVPSYSLPEDAVRALTSVTRHAQWRSRDRGQPVDPDGIDRERAERRHRGRALRDARRAGPDPPRGDRAARGLRDPALARGPRDERRRGCGGGCRDDLPGHPQVGITHRPPPAGLIGVRADLGDADAVRDAYASLSDRLGVIGRDDFLVQRMAVPGVSCVLRATEDPLFGPVVSFSIAGPPTDLLDDIAHRIPPLTDIDVTDLIDGVKAAPLLFGHRGAAPVHRAALADLVARLSVLADDHSDLASVHLNPVNAWTGGVDILGAEIIVRPALLRTDPGRRRMT